MAYIMLHALFAIDWAEESPMNTFFTRCLKRLLPLGFAASAAAVLLAPVPASASPYIVRLVQDGSSVVASGSGSVDLTGLTFDQEYLFGAASLWPSLGYLLAGTGGDLDGYTGFVGPASFGSGSFPVEAARTGDRVGIIGSSSSFGHPVLWVPTGYLSASALSNTSTFASASFTSLGVTPGSYVWTWGTGAEQSFTLNIVEVPKIDAPEPAALGMFGLGALLIGAFVGLRRRAA